MTSLHKLPRIYVNAPLSIQEKVPLSPEQGHYLKNVLRQKPNDQIRLFNGRDGEWLYYLSTLEKKHAEAACIKLLKEQCEQSRRIHLVFAPIKKTRMDFLIEKTVELGATDLHPVITERTEARKINQERIAAQIIEATEQCERMDLPVFHSLQHLVEKLEYWPLEIPLLAALERDQTASLINEIQIKGDIAALTGPEGGLSDQEISLLKRHEAITPVSLGNHILRAETAACKILSIL